MAFRPVIPVINLATGLDETSTTVLVQLRPFGNVSGQINCSRLGTSHRYRADTNIDENIAYHVFIDGTKQSMIFDDNVGTDKMDTFSSF